MENAKKVTKREYFALVKEIVSASGDARAEEINVFIDHEVELLNKKSAKSGSTKTQKTNAAILETIKTVLSEAEKPMTIPELMTDARLATYIDGEETKKMTSQKLSALLTQLGTGEKGTGEVVKTYEKKVAYFSLNTPTEAE
jgi:vancomycin resistance protein YoaR